jgi:hypothetical protein
MGTHIIIDELAYEFWQSYLAWQGQPTDPEKKFSKYLEAMIENARERAANPLLLRDREKE